MLTRTYRSVFFANLLVLNNEWSKSCNANLFPDVLRGQLQADAPVQDPATADDGDAPLPADDIDVDLDLLLSGSGTDEYYGDSAVRAPVNADIATNDGRCSAILPGLNALLSELQHSEEINVWPTVNHGGRQPAPEITCSEQGAVRNANACTPIACHSFTMKLVSWAGGCVRVRCSCVAGGTTPVNAGL